MKGRQGFVQRYRAEPGPRRLVTSRLIMRTVQKRRDARVVLADRVRAGVVPRERYPYRDRQLRAGPAPFNW